MNNYWKGRSVLVTGGTGFIGRHLVKRLHELQASVVVISSSKKTLESAKQIPVINGDLTDKDIVSKIVKPADVIMHLAALDGDSEFKIKYSKEIFYQNSQMVLHILNACKDKNKKILFMSSVEVYPKRAQSPITENEAMFTDSDSQISGYVWSKRLTEIAANVFAHNQKLQVSIARCGNIYGPGDMPSSKRKRVIPTFINNALRNRDIHIVGNGKQRYSFLYVKDLVNALLSLTVNYAVCDPINLAGSEIVTLKQLAKKVIKLTNSKSNIILADPKTSIPDRIISNKKAREKITFREEYDLEKGLIETITFLQKKIQPS